MSQRLPGLASRLPSGRQLLNHVERVGILSGWADFAVCMAMREGGAMLSSEAFFLSLFEHAMTFSFFNSGVDGEVVD